MENHRILVDTSILIDYFRKKNKQNSMLYKLSLGNDIVTSAVCYFEFMVGAKTIDLPFIHDLFQKIEILPFNTNVAQISAQIYKQLKKQNQIIEFRDIFIAATAIVNDVELATINIRHFKRVADLKLHI